MSDQLPNEYWESLGQNGLFLWSLFQGQHEQLQQLQELNTFLQSRVTDTWDDITNVASATASTVAQAITTNPWARSEERVQQQLSYSCPESRTGKKAM